MGGEEGRSEVLNVGRHAVEEVIFSVRAAPREALQRQGCSQFLLSKVRYDSCWWPDGKTSLAV